MTFSVYKCIRRDRRLLSVEIWKRTDLTPFEQFFVFKLIIIGFFFCGKRMWSNIFVLLLALATFQSIHAQTQSKLYSFIDFKLNFKCFFVKFN